MTTDQDIMHMHRAFELARRAEGFTSPNPMVGCVLVKDGAVIAEGWHRGPGHPHAEADALAKAGDAARGATAYVTLEPCNHYGNTPPCTEALIGADVAEVVYAVADPNPVAAGGADRLRGVGITVRDGVCEAEGRALLRPWLHSLSHPHPYVYAKLAMTLDGRTATRTGDSKWITGSMARAKGHILRQRTDAILVGVTTVMADDPGLDPRPEGAEPAPSLKVVLDTELKILPTAKLFTTPGPVLLATGPEPDPKRRAGIEEAGGTVLPLPLENGKPSLSALLKHLKAQGFTSVMIEGGGTLLGAAFAQGLVDEVWAFVAPMILGGGRSAISGKGPDVLTDALSLEEMRTEQLGPDLFVQGLIRKEEAASCSQAS